MGIFKSKWEKMVLQILQLSFGKAQVFIIGKDGNGISKDEWKNHLQKLIGDEITNSDKYYHFFCYSCSIDNKHESALRCNSKGKDILSNIEKQIDLSDAIKISVNEMRPDFYEYICRYIEEKRHDLLSSMDYYMRPPIKNFIAIKGK